MYEPLSAFADIHYGKSPIGIVDAEGVIPIYGTGGVYGQATTSLFPGPAVIVPRKGSLSSTHFADGPFWASDTTYAAIPKKGVDAKWLYYQLSLFNLEALNEATGVPSINRDWLAKIGIFPHHHYQQITISRVLRALDTLIEATEGLIVKQERVRAGLLQDLFTRGVDDHGQLRPPRDQAPHLYHQTELDWLPLGWEVMNLSNACSVIRDGTHLPPQRTEAGPLLLSVRNMVDGGIQLTESDERVPESFFEIMHRNWRIRPGDTLLAIVGATIGKTCQVPDEFPKFTLQRSVCVLRGETGILTPDFLALLIQRPAFYTALWSRANQTAQPGIYLDQIAKISVPVPLMHEQQTVCAAMKAASGRIAALKADLSKLRLQKSGLMQDLLSGKVSVAPLLERTLESVPA